MYFLLLKVHYTGKQQRCRMLKGIQIFRVRFANGLMWFQTKIYRSRFMIQIWQHELLHKPIYPHIKSIKPHTSFVPFDNWNPSVFLPFISVRCTELSGSHFQSRFHTFRCDFAGQLNEFKTNSGLNCRTGALCCAVKTSCKLLLPMTATDYGAPSPLWGKNIFSLKC